MKTGKRRAKAVSRPAQQHSPATQLERQGTPAPTLPSKPASAVYLHSPGATAALFATFSALALWVVQTNAAFRSYLAAPESLLVLLTGFFALFAIAGIRNESGRRDLVVIGGVVALTWPATKLVSLMDVGLLPVRASVGYVTYLGYPKLKDYFAGAAALTIAALVGAAVWRWFPRPQDVASAPAEGANLRWGWWLTMMVAVVAALYQANLSGAAWQFQNVPVTTAGWDGMHAMVWRYAAHLGAVPYRDFWYPYSGQYLLTHRLPWGPLFSWLHFVVSVGCLAAGLVLANGKRVMFAAACTAFLLVCFQAQIFQGWWRYLVSIDIALMFILGEQSRFVSWAQIGRAALCAYAMFFEPPQLAYGLVGICVARLGQAGEAFLQHSGDRSARVLEAGSRLAFEAIHIGLPALAGIVIALAGFATDGMLSGFVDFARTLGDQSVYSAYPADVSSWARPNLHSDAVFLVFIVIAAMAVYWFLNGDRFAPLLLAISVTGAFCLQKLIMRPHMMRQFAIYTAVGVAVYVMMRWRTRLPEQTVLACGFAGILVALAWAHGVHTVWGACIATAVPTAKANYALLVHGWEEMERANAARFAPWKFEQAEERNLATSLRQDLGLRPGDQIYVMGDTSILYPMLSQPIPFQINMYNGTPLAEQNTTVAWLDRMRPRFVIWDDASVIFDAVPHVVRVPHVFRYVQSHYEPAATVGRFHVLRRAGRPGNLHLDFWRERLGASVDVGHIPRHSKIDDYPLCGGADCQDVLRVHFRRSPVFARKSFIRLAVDGAWYMVYFDVVPEQADYVVNLSRLWLWPGARGVSRVLTEPEAEHTLEQRGGVSSVLY